MNSIQTWFQDTQNNLLVAFTGLLFFMLTIISVSKQAYALSLQNEAEKQASLAQVKPVDLYQVYPYQNAVNQKDGGNSTQCLSATFTDEVKYWEPEICRWSEEHQIDPDLIATVMQIESCGDYLAVSATGVRGLFQVTGANLDGGDPFDPEVSMAKGPGKVLKAELEAAKGNVKAAMAGYNGGPWARQWIGGEISQSQFAYKLQTHPSGYWYSWNKAAAKLNEVEHYAKWAHIYFEAKQNKTDTLQEWLDMGGQRLCDQASTTLAQNPPRQVLPGPVTASQTISQ